MLVEVKKLKKKIGDQSISIFLSLKANVKGFDSKVFVAKNNTYLCTYVLRTNRDPFQSKDLIGQIMPSILPEALLPRLEVILTDHPYRQ